MEYASAAEVSEAVERYKELELGEQKLYIIKSMTERKEAYGKCFVLLLLNGRPMFIASRTDLKLSLFIGCLCNIV